MTDVHDRVRRAQQMDGPPFHLPWTSFADFLVSRLHDLRLAHQSFLTYVDDERNLCRRHSYADFGELVARVADFLNQELGLGRGARIATVLFNHDQTVILYFAAWSLGIGVVPINAEEPIEKKQYILDHSEASAVFCWKDSVDEILAIQSQVPHLRTVVQVEDGPGVFKTLAGASRGDASTLSVSKAGPTDLEDIALIVYTSGTTGPPKGVILTARNLLIDADAIAGWHGFGPSSRLMCVLPIHHVNGTVVTLVTPLYARCGAVLNRKFRTSSFWKRLHDERVSCVSVVPTLLEYLLETGEDLRPYRLDHFQGVICGAGPLLKDTAQRFEDRFGFPIRHGYGLSETTCYSCFLPADLPTDRHRHWLTDFEFPSIGLALPHNEMAILDEHGHPVAEHARGEICIRGRTVCAGYFKRPDANEAAFQWGWFRSGDEGFYVRDERQRPFLFISGRLKELIIRGGINISPLEIDDVLKGHPAVKFAMAVPFENRYYGEEIAAYVVPTDSTAPPSDQELLGFCRTRLPFAKRPKVVLFGTDVPYTTTGKPKRLELKARLAPALAPYRDTQFKEPA